MDIRTRRALVTGAGSGIGRTTARMLAERGAAEVIVVDLIAANAEETADLVRRAGARAMTVPVDVSDVEALEWLFQDGTVGALDIVFNNAGIVSGQPRFPDTPKSRILEVVAVNLVGVIVGTQFAAQNMIRHAKRGVIINTASNKALEPGRNDPVYCASKAGVLMFTRSCIDLAEQHGIRVNAVLPAITETPMLKATGGAKPADWQLASLANVKVLQPEDIGDAVLRLIEDDSRACEYELISNIAA